MKPALARILALFAQAALAHPGHADAQAHDLVAPLFLVALWLMLAGAAIVSRRVQS